jgi:beta-lactamase superfamily II metal-dependent hydrolase
MEMSRNRPFSVALAALVAACTPASSQYADALQITFLDVGQGDAVLIRSPEGKVALVDAGPSPIAGPLHRRYGVDTIDLAVATHPHADHIGGMAGVLQAFPVRYYMDNGEAHTTSTYGHLMEVVRRSDIVYLQATARTIELGSARITVLPPPERAAGQNNRSIGLLLEYGEFRALLTGDSETEELDHFLALGVPDVTLLKAAHHGSRDAVTPAWLAASKPEVVVVTVGRGNAYGHPHPWALRYYETTGTVYRTDLHGDVTVLGTQDGGFEVSTRFAAAAVETATADAAPAPLTLWVFPDAPGDDTENLNGEYAVVKNNTAGAVDIGGWGVCDARDVCYQFPEGAAVGAGDSVVVYSGSGRDGSRSFYMGRRHPVWGNSGDFARLRDDIWEVVAEYAY